MWFLLWKYKHILLTGTEHDLSPNIFVNAKVIVGKKVVSILAQTFTWIISDNTRYNYNYDSITLKEVDCELKFLCVTLLFLKIYSYIKNFKCVYSDDFLRYTTHILTKGKAISIGLNALCVTKLGICQVTYYLLISESIHNYILVFVPL